MKNILVLFISFICSSVFAQTKVFEIPLEENGEKSYTYVSFRKILDDIPLDSLENSKYDFHFRYITARHITEIWKNENGKLDGVLISFVERQPDLKDLDYLNNKTPKTYFATSQKLKRRTLKTIYEKFVDIKLDTMHSKLMPVGENKNVSGIVIEFVSGDSYKFKEFWISNIAEDHDSNDKLLGEFTALMKTKMNYEKAYKKLQKALPKGCFNMANGFVTCK